MTDAEVIEWLMKQYGDTLMERVAVTIDELKAENNLLKTSGIIEVAVRNPNVMEYIKHWEGRAEAAEAKLAKAVEALELIVVDNTWGLEHQTYMKCRKSLAEIRGESHE